MARWSNLLSKKPQRKSAPEVIDHVEREINGEKVKVPIYSESRQRKRSYMKVRASGTKEGMEAYVPDNEQDEVVEENIGEVYVK